jgi:hypothetical protein
MRIDLWTKEMPVDEMKIFFHQTLVLDVRYFSSRLEMKKKWQIR